MKERKKVRGRFLRQVARRTIRIEAEALQHLSERIGESFERGIESILSCRGKVIVLGMGKSGLVGQKIAASLASTGIPAFFVHPAEAAHGDLGTIRREDLVIAISHSGETEEVNRLLPTFKRIGLKIIALTASRDSTLAQAASLILDTSVPREADPLNMIPTSSTTATLALGDALLVALMKVRGFRREDFALLHPGGAAGRMLMKVKDLMRTGKDNPVVQVSVPFQKALLRMTEKGLGAVSLVGADGRLRGIITDGDVRRILQRYGEKENVLALQAGKVMTRNPKHIRPERPAGEAVEIMEANKITVLPVTDGERRPVGMIHLHALVQAGFSLRQSNETDLRLR